MYNIIIIGNGGREHTLAWKLKQSPLLNQLFILNGNAGTEQFGSNIQIKPNDFDEIARFCIQEHIHLIVVGSEETLALGIVDYFKTKYPQICVLGPDKFATQLESSKDFAKQFMERHNIPTASYKTFLKSDIQECLAYIKTQQYPLVIKADGLAAGKGVVIAENQSHAEEFILSLFKDNLLGNSGDKVVIEEFLSGKELSVFVLTDGKKYILLPEAKDYKRIGDNDTGLNTGGMGSISPVPFYDEELKAKVIQKIIIPTIEGIKQEQLNYKGFIFFGLIEVSGEPFVIEYNVRLGDPETQSILPRISDDLLPILIDVAQGELKIDSLIFTDKCVATVVAVSGGYPEQYEKGKIINGLEGLEDSNTLIIHAGTSKKENKVITSGGRVLAVTSFGNTIKDALDNSYNKLHKISFDKIYFRKDIGSI